MIVVFFFSTVFACVSSVGSFYDNFVFSVILSFSAFFLNAIDPKVFPPGATL